MIKIGTLRYDGPLGLVLRTFWYRDEVAKLYMEMNHLATDLILDEVDSWLEEYVEKHGEIDNGYRSFIHQKRGDICEKVNNLYGNNDFGLYIYNDENNRIRFAYVDGCMNDTGMTELEYRYMNG